VPLSLFLRGKTQYRYGSFRRALKFFLPLFLQKMRLTSPLSRRKIKDMNTALWDVSRVSRCVNAQNVHTRRLTRLLTEKSSKHILISSSNDNKKPLEKFSRISDFFSILSSTFAAIIRISNTVSFYARTMKLQLSQDDLFIWRRFTFKKRKYILLLSQIRAFPEAVKQLQHSFS